MTVSLRFEPKAPYQASWDTRGNLIMGDAFALVEVSANHVVALLRAICSNPQAFKRELQTEGAPHIEVAEGLVRLCHELGVRPYRDRDSFTPPKVVQATAFVGPPDCVMRFQMKCMLARAIQFTRDHSADEPVTWRNVRFLLQTSYDYLAAAEGVSSPNPRSGNNSEVSSASLEESS